jgi:copper homeostasis protein (lipoprotein)
MNKWLGPVFIIAFIFCLGAGFYIYSSKWPAVTYVGILPGADCAGLKTELSLFKDNTFYLKETYLATRDGDKIFISTGQWQKIKSGQRDIIRLNYNKPLESYNFLQKDPDHIVVVGKELREIPTPMNLTLTRI